MRILSLMLAAALLATPSPSFANPLNQWRISCGVDAGSIKRKGKTWTFRTSSNKCPGGIFRQRAEIASERVSPTTRGAYMFTSYVTMRTQSSEKYDIFQMHDGRRGCAPPLKLTVKRDRRMELTSDLKTGPGESCLRGWLDRRQTPGRIRNDGTEQKLEVLVDFDGSGGFATTVWLDGVVQLSGVYEVPNDPRYFKSEFFYFKHGVYSQRVFDYEFTSRDMRVRRVRVKN